MKTRFLLLCLALAGALPLGAADQPAKPDAKASTLPVLGIVIAENLSSRSSAIDEFVRTELAFRYVAKQRGWPVRIEAERFAANIPNFDPELRIFLQPIQQDTPMERTFRAWMTLTANGEKHDFKMILFRYYPRAGENFEDSMEKMYRGAAMKAAEKIEPILFPDLAKQK